MVQPLRFPAASPAPVTSERGPKPLSFASAPASAVQAEQVKDIKPLTFPPAPPTKPTPSGEVRAVFQQTLSPLAKSVVAQLKTSYPDEYAKRGPLLERQINQLLPIDLNKVLGWASNSLTNSGEVATHCGKLVREFIDTKGSVVIDETVKIVSGKLSFFEKLGNRSGEVTTKPQLTVLKVTHVRLLEQVDQLQKEAELAAERLINKMTSLRVIADVCGKLPDVTLANALHERQTLIAQAATQSQLTIQQLKDVRMQIADQLSRVDQLLIATIPAYENAKARR